MSDRLAYVTGGLVVTPDGVREADVRIGDGRVAELLPPAVRRANAVNARGCYVLPGGVDPHTHLLADVAASTRSAALGGTTTAISFTLPRPGESPAEAVRRARDELLSRAAVDVALHAYVAEPDRLTAADVEEVATLGVTGVKLFTAYRELGLQASDRTVYETLRAASGVGLRVLVHCENGDLIAALVDELTAAGRRDARAFAEARPPETEAEAVARVLVIAKLARGRAYLVHLSTREAARHVQEARAHGVDVLAEACVHHLALDASVYDGPDAARYLVVPPLRTREHVDGLWTAVRDGTIAAIGSDHAQERFRPEPRDDFTGLPYGFGGVEARMPIALSLGRERGVSLERLVTLLCTSPARTFGLFPAKGAIIPGADADLVVWDARSQWTVESACFHDGHPDAPYAGLRVHGRIRYVIRRGQLLVADGELVGEDPGGGYLAAPGVAATPEAGPSAERGTSAIA